MNPRISGIMEMSKGYADLAVAANKIEEGQSQLDDAKEQAKDSADLNTILTMDTLKNLLTAQNFSMPAGYVTEGNEQYLVRVGDEVTSKADLENLVLMDLGMDGIEPIRLSDVADIEYIDNSGDSYSKVNGNPAVMLSIEKQTGYSTGDVTDRLLDKFDSLEKENTALHLSVLMNQGIYIDMIVKSVVENIIVGAILAIIVLLLFLKDIKPTLVIACSIPLSVVFAVVLMYFTHITLNIISLSGLALGIGMLVDNSIGRDREHLSIAGRGIFHPESSRGRCFTGDRSDHSFHTYNRLCICTDYFYRGYHKTVICGYCADNCIYACSQSSCGIDFRADDGSRIIKKYKRDQA